MRSESLIDWSTARVRAGRLKVQLAGRPPRHFKRYFGAVEHVLGGHDWGEVTVKKRTVRVEAVRPGAEERLRHHLESLVEQAEARASAEERPGVADRDRREEPERDPDDRTMEMRFRSYAAAPTAPA